MFSVVGKLCKVFVKHHSQTSFHWNYTKGFHLAEKYYQLAIEADKNNVWPICNYATFLWDVKHRLDESEKVFSTILLISSIMNVRCILIAPILIRY
jgi:hypothetical protein